jgi:hypothetical protein
MNLHMFLHTALSSILVLLILSITSLRDGKEDTMSIACHWTLTTDLLLRRIGLDDVWKLMVPVSMWFRPPASQQHARFTAYRMPQSLSNYSVIKLIVSIAGRWAWCGGISDKSRKQEKLQSQKNKQNTTSQLQVMMRRLGTCRTFGEMIFMMNRASKSGLVFFMIASHPFL